VLRVEGLRIDGLPALTFEVAGGECLAVEGPSGSGKTRLLRAMADLDPCEGRVLLDYTERGLMPAPHWRRRVRFVATEQHWWHPTALAHLPAGPVTERHVAALGLSPDHLKQDIATLSTGERQRLALVRALADDPKVLLLDEPTSALDQGAVALVEEHLRFLLLQGRIVVIVSHDPAQIERLCHQRLQLAPMPPVETAP
jgi:ABC-type multidrug transport system ATPase subunit